MTGRSFRPAEPRRQASAARQAAAKPGRDGQAPVTHGETRQGEQTLAPHTCTIARTTCDDRDTLFSQGHLETSRSLLERPVELMAWLAPPGSRRAEKADFSRCPQVARTGWQGARILQPAHCRTALACSVNGFSLAALRPGRLTGKTTGGSLPGACRPSNNLIGNKAPHPLLATRLQGRSRAPITLSDHLSNRRV